MISVCDWVSIKIKPDQNQMVINFCGLLYHEFKKLCLINTHMYVSAL